MKSATAALSVAATKDPLKNSVRVKTVLPATRPHWVGNGFHVYPVFNQLAFTSAISPFLMLDYAAPKEFPPSKGRERRGVGQHPHRGFETVTIAFQGEVEHGDSVGNHDVIGPGDVQWMTAGRGIIHEEYHAESFARKGGTFEMVQLWVNLPAKHKMDAPRYQPILAASIPEIPVAPATSTSTSSSSSSSSSSNQDSEEEQQCADGAAVAGKVRVIAGHFRGETGPAQTHTPMDLWDVSLPSVGVPVDLEMKAGHNILVFSRAGGVKVGGSGDGKEVGPQSMAILDNRGGGSGDTVLRLTAMKPGTKLLILGGEPINEPIAARGPFVMNTNAEIAQANADYRSGKMGR